MSRIFSILPTMRFPINTTAAAKTTTTRATSSILRSRWLSYQQQQLHYPSSSLIFSRMASSSTTTSPSLATPVGDVDGGPITDIIISRIQETLKPSTFIIHNDSSRHAHHAEQRKSSNKIESHFRLEIVSDQFKGKSPALRHRLVYGLFKEEMAMQNGIHSISLKTKTPEEWAKMQQQ